MEYKRSLLAGLRSPVAIAAVGCLAGLLAWPETPQMRFVAVLLGVILPLVLCGIIILAPQLYGGAKKLTFGKRQFTLRGLLFFVVVCNVALAAWNRFGRPSWEQRQFLAAVERLGGSSYVDSASREVRISLAGMTDDELAYLAAQPGRRHVSSIDVANSSLTDAGMVHLLDFPELTAIFLKGCQITDGGLATLSEAESLTTVAIMGSRSITDDGLAELRRFPRLTGVSFSDCPNVTDNGVAWLVTMPELKGINLMNTKVTPTKMEELSRDLPHCTILRNIP